MTQNLRCGLESRSNHKPTVFQHPEIEKISMRPMGDGEKTNIFYPCDLSLELCEAELYDYVKIDIVVACSVPSNFPFHILYNVRKIPVYFEYIIEIPYTN